MDFSILTQASTADIVKELKSRLDIGHLNNYMPLLIGANELNSLLISIEVYLMNQYAEQRGYDDNF